MYLVGEKIKQDEYIGPVWIQRAKSMGDPNRRAKSGG
jgi:disulfide oxidoreductase YuzD